MRRPRLLLLLLAGCATPFRAPPATGDEIAIFIPGYQGSFLMTDATPGKMAWINPGQGICPGSETLALPFEGERALPTFGPLHADSPLTRLTIIPAIADADIYGDWMEYGTKNLPGFIPFGYDWRQDIRQTATQLGALIDKTIAAHPGELKINLIGHSMGGLIALYYLRYGADRNATAVTWGGTRHVQHVVFVGSPFHGAPGILKDLLVGTPSGLNHALLSKEALFTFPAAFQLMAASDDYFRDEQGQPTPVAVSNPTTWCEQGWSVFADRSLCGDPAYQTHLTSMLTAHTETSRALGDIAEAPPATLKAMAVIGHGRDVTVAERMTKGHLDLDHPFTADGDGTVLAASAVPTQPLEYEKVETSAPHVWLLNDPKVRAAIASFLHR